MEQLKNNKLYNKENLVKFLCTSIFCIIVILLLSSTIATAATIQGTIYDISLNKVQNILIAINTQPEQKFLVKTGIYEFQVNSGNYILKITNPLTKEILNKEMINITQEGTYTVDLFLTEEENFSAILDNTKETNIIRETSNDINLISNKNKQNSLLIISIILIIVGTLLLVFYRYLRKKTEKEEDFSIKIKEDSVVKDFISWKNTEDTENLDNDLNKILSIIKEEGNRTTQKEIRKHFPLSEAKISLMLTELEHKNKIERIKKGRSNIILLK